MTRSMPGLPVHHQLPEFTQTHVHQIGNAIQPSHPLSSPSPPACNPSQHQHPLDHWKSKRVPEKHLLQLYWLCQRLWLCGGGLVDKSCPTLATPWSVVHQAPLSMGFWIAIFFSRGSFWPRNRTWFSCIAGRFFTNWAMREALITDCVNHNKLENSSRVGNNRPPYLPPEKSVCKSGSNS